MTQIFLSSDRASSFRRTEETSDERCAAFAVVSREESGSPKNITVPWNWGEEGPPLGPSARSAEASGPGSADQPCLGSRAPLSTFIAFCASVSSTLAGYQLEN